LFDLELIMKVVVSL